jgi:hypothetical protein
MLYVACCMLQQCCMALRCSAKRCRAACTVSTQSAYCEYSYYHGSQVLGKALSGGVYPVSAVLTRDEVRCDLLVAATDQLTD